MPLTPIHIVTLEDLGFQIVHRDYSDPIRQEAMAKIRDYIDDRDPTVDFFRDEDGNEYALVAHNSDGHGDYTLFKI